MEKTNDNLTQPAQDRFKLLREYAVITAGLFLAALAIYFFMMPSNIIFGSITGLAMVLVHFIPVSVSVMTFILNLFCLVIGFVFVGKEFGAKPSTPRCCCRCFCTSLRCSSQTTLH